MLAIAVIALLGQQPPPPEPLAPPIEKEKIDVVQVIRGQASYDLQWADADDRLQGTVRPLDPVAERPVELSVMVGTFQGAEFNGPVTMTMRCPEWSETKTVSRAKGERAWFASFVPARGDAECNVDVGFTTTRHKLLHFKLAVLPAPLSRLPWYFILGALLLAAFGFGIRAIFKKPEQP